MRRLWMLIPICIASTPSADPRCDHASAGDSIPVSLEHVGKAQDELRNRLTITWDKALRLSSPGSFDSGLPSCKGRQTRRLRTLLPPELVGRTIAFSGPDGMPAADIQVATSARRLAELRADALADPKLIERLGVRCAPTLVRAISEVELELVEDP